MAARSFRAVLALAALAVPVGVGQLAVSGPAAADVHGAGPWCAESGATAPCVVSASYTHAGTTHSVALGDPTWDVSISSGTSSGTSAVLWQVDHWDGTAMTTVLPDADEGDRWTVTVDVGDLVPRVTYTYGGLGSTSRSTSGGNNVVSVTSSVIRFGNGDCDQSAVPWTCSNPATSDSIGLAGYIDDENSYTDKAFRDSITGMDLWTNVEAFDFPPSLIGSDPATVYTTLASPHRWSDGSVISGFYDVNIPDGYLSYLGVSDPTTLVPGALQGSVESGSMTLTTASDHVALRADGITFPDPGASPGFRHGRSASIDASPAKRFNSQRVLRLHVDLAKVRPSRPTRLTVHRSGTTATFVVHGVRARGEQLLAREVSCSGQRVPARHGRAKGTTVRVTRLARHAAYRCRARGIARPEPGAWSKWVRLRP